MKAITETQYLQILNLFVSTDPYRAEWMRNHFLLDGKVMATDTAAAIRFDPVLAQCAIIQAGLADIAEVFLPYAITKNGTTLYKEIKSNNNLLLKE